MSDAWGYSENHHISTSSGAAHYPEYEPDLLRRYENKGVTYRIDETNVPGRVRITNSYKIDKWAVMVDYTVQLKESNPNAFTGSTTGFVFEWWVHSKAYKIPWLSEVTKDKLASLDAGNTIFDDNHDEASSIMQYFYFVFHYESAYSDYKIHASN
jgi:hypothetical protein